MAGMLAVASIWLSGTPNACMGESPPDHEPSVPYRASLKGIRYGELKKAVREQSLTISLTDYPPATLRQLWQRAEDDRPAMASAMKASGYLDASVTVDIDTNQTPVRVVFYARKGPRYTLRTFRVVNPPAMEGAPPFSQQPRLRKRTAASVENVKAYEEEALRILQRRGHPHPRVLERAVIRDKDRKAVDVVCTVDPGPTATLGAGEIQGLSRLQPRYVCRRIPWTPGDRYDVEELEDLEKDLLRSGLFSAVRVAATGEPDAAGHLPVLIHLAERSPRTFRAGVSYYTDEGFGAQTSWEHRNLFGNAEALAFTLTASEILYDAKGRFLRPDVGFSGLDLHLEVGASDEHPDAYRSQESRYSTWLEKQLADVLTLKGGAAYELDLVSQQGDESGFGLASLPLSIDWDLRDDPMDPFRGAGLFLATTPYRDAGNDLAFVKSYGEASFYLPLSRSPRVVLATRAAYGTISGEETVDVPADKRFYAGGGGTVRGYKYQSIGERVDGDPTGGNSMANVSAELRARATRTLGLALFIDGGTAYPDSHPDADTPFLWGAGVGVRYYLGFAPLRMDIAFPLQRREDVDAPFQVYISLGQSF